MGIKGRIKGLYNQTKARTQITKEKIKVIIRCKDHEDVLDSEWKVVDEADEKGTNLVAPE